MCTPSTDDRWPSSFPPFFDGSTVRGHSSARERALAVLMADDQQFTSYGWTRKEKEPKRKKSAELTAVQPTTLWWLGPRTRLGRRSTGRRTLTRRGLSNKEDCSASALSLVVFPSLSSHHTGLCGVFLFCCKGGLDDVFLGADEDA